MKELQSLLEKVRQSGIDVTKKSTHKHIYFQDGLNVSYRIEINRVGEGAVFNALVLINFNGKNIKFWGCTETEENRLVVEWFDEQYERYYASKELIEGIEAHRIEKMFDL